MLKVGIVGTGSFARQHATAWRSVEGVELVGAYGADSQRLASYADRQSLQPFADLADLIDRADLIDIVSANRDHFAHAVQAVRAGRAIVVEKPLCTTLNNAESLQALVEEAGVLAAVVSQHRFHPANRAVKRRLQRDGGIHFVNAVCVLPRPASYYADHGGWRDSATAAGGGVLIHQAIHYIDLFIWWHGYPASWDGHWLFEDPQDDAVERRFWGELQNEGGVTIQFLFSTEPLGQSCERISFYGADAAFDVGPLGVFDHGNKGHAVKGLRFLQSRLRKPPNSTDLLRAQFADVLAAWKRGGQPEVSTADGTRAIRLVDALYTSARVKESDDRPSLT